MLRQSITAAASLLLVAQVALAETPPFRVTLLDGGPDGGTWRAGIRIELDPGWKTYWRMPGEAGIPPDFGWTTEPGTRVTVEFPTPARYADASGETIGYEKEVLFPVEVASAGNPPYRLALQLFFAVCREICIPARAEAVTDLGASPADSKSKLSIAAAIARLPEKGDVVTGAQLGLQGEKPVLELSLRDGVEDIFIESDSTAYFRAPQFSADGKRASLMIDNIKDLAQLKGKVLKLTYVAQGIGLEQSVMLP